MFKQKQIFINSDEVFSVDVYYIHVLILWTPFTQILDELIITGSRKKKSCSGFCYIILLFLCPFSVVVHLHYKHGIFESFTTTALLIQIYVNNIIRFVKFNDIVNFREYENFPP